MKATPSQNPPKSSAAAAASEAAYLDVGQLAAALTDLNIARKTVHIYPAHHDQVRLSLARSHKSLTRILHLNKHLTLGIGKDALLLDGEPLDPHNKTFGELARAFRQHEIAGLTLTQGIEMDELMGLLKWSARRPQDCPKAGQTGTPAEGQTACWPHIQLTMVDYTQFQLTEEAAIGRTPNQPPGKETTSLWSEFVSQLTAGTLTHEDSGVGLNELKTMNPQALARLLNENRLDPQAALHSFDRLFQDKFQAGPKSPQPAQAAAPSSSELSELSQLLNELNPDLQRQFLSVAGIHCPSGAESAGDPALLGGTSYPLVVEMLRQANAQAQEVSPSLLRLVQKIGTTDGQQQPPNATVAHDLSNPTPFDPASKADFKTLFEREAYETYVSEDYQALLDRADQAQHPAKSPQDPDFPIDEHLATLQDQHLDAQIARLVLAFMHNTIPAQEYRAYAEQLAGLAYALLEAQNFDLVLSIYRQLKRHAKEKADPQIRKIAAETIDKFSAPLMTSKAVSVFHLTDQPANGKAFAFLIALGPKLIPDAVRLYAEQDRPPSNSPLFMLLDHFRSETIIEAQRRLVDSRSAFVSHLIALLRTLNAREACGRLCQLLDHQDPDVQLEALAALMKFGDESALPYFRKTIRGSRRPVSDRVIELAGRYRVKWAAPELAGMIRCFFLLRSDYPRNNKLIQALGRIGDGFAVAHLANLAQKKWSLHPAELRRTQRILFHSLSRYAYEDIRQLLPIGFKSKDETIRRACQKLLDVRGKIRPAQSKKRDLK